MEDKVIESESVLFWVRVELKSFHRVQNKESLPAGQVLAGKQQADDLLCEERQVQAAISLDNLWYLGLRDWASLFQVGEQFGTHDTDHFLDS